MSIPSVATRYSCAYFLHLCLTCNTLLQLSWCHDLNAVPAAQYAHTMHEADMPVAVIQALIYIAHLTSWALQQYDVHADHAR